MGKIFRFENLNAFPAQRLRKSAAYLHFSLARTLFVYSPRANVQKFIRRIAGLFANKMFFRYLCTGGLNTCIHWGVFLVLDLGFHMGQASANICAFIVAVTFSYFANARWTFSTTPSLRTYFVYTPFMAVMAGLIGMAGQVFRFHPLLTLCLFSAISLVCGYLYARFIAFGDRPL